MINEKPNSNINWKNKLEELESSAGEVFNKEAAWGKLHTRLQSKRKNKKEYGIGLQPHVYYLHYLYHSSFQIKKKMFW